MGTVWLMQVADGDHVERAFGSTLQVFRRQARLTQEQLARRLAAAGADVSQSLISLWEGGTRMPTDPAQVAALAVAMERPEVDAARLFRAAGLDPAARSAAPALRMRLTAVLNRTEELNGDAALVAEDIRRRIADHEAYIRAAGMLDRGDWAGARESLGDLRDRLGRSRSGMLEPFVALRFAEVLSKLGDFEAAGRMLLTETDLPEDDTLRAMLLGRRGLIQLRLGRFAEAEADLVRSEQIFNAAAPGDDRVLLHRAWARKRVGQWRMFVGDFVEARDALEDSLMLFDAAAARAPAGHSERGKVAVHYLLGWAYQEMGRAGGEHPGRAVHHHRQGLEIAHRLQIRWRVMQGHHYLSEDCRKLLLPPDEVDGLASLAEIGGHPRPTATDDAQFRLEVGCALAATALQISDQLGDVVNKGRILLNLAKLEIALAEGSVNARREEHLQAAQQYLVGAEKTERDVRARNAAAATEGTTVAWDHRLAWVWEAWSRYHTLRGSAADAQTYSRRAQEALQRMKEQMPPRVPTRDRIDDRVRRLVALSDATARLSA
jgi:tetratricopeptide (TPR) repeat protein